MAKRTKYRVLRLTEADDGSDPSGLATHRPPPGPRTGSGADWVTKTGSKRTSPNAPLAGTYSWCSPAPKPRRTGRTGGISTGPWVDARGTPGGSTWAEATTRRGQFAPGPRDVYLDDVAGAGCSALIGGRGAGWQGVSYGDAMRGGHGGGCTSAAIVRRDGRAAGRRVGLVRPDQGSRGGQPQIGTFQLIQG